MFLVFVPCTPTSTLNTAFNSIYVIDKRCHLMLCYSLNLQICYLQSSVFFVALAYECFCVERVSASACAWVSWVAREEGRERGNQTNGRIRDIKKIDWIPLIMFYHDGELSLSPSLPQICCKNNSWIMRPSNELRACSTPYHNVLNFAPLENFSTFFCSGVQNESGKVGIN